MLYVFFHKNVFSQSPSHQSGLPVWAPKLGMPKIGILRCPNRPKISPAS